MSNQKKILFVDDDPDFLAAIQRAFRHSVALDVAASGAEALERLRTQGPYAIIVADLAMPGMDGMALLARVSAEAPEIVQIVLTGDSNIETFAESIERTKVFRYVAKSPDGETLRAVLIDALREVERRGEERT